MLLYFAIQPSPYCFNNLDKYLNYPLFIRVGALKAYNLYFIYKLKITL